MKKELSSVEQERRLSIFREQLNDGDFWLRGNRVVCEFRARGNDPHLICYCLDSDGNSQSPCLTLELGEKENFLIQTYRQEAFEIPAGSDAPEAVHRVLESMNPCLMIPKEVIDKLGLKQIELDYDGE